MSSLSNLKRLKSVGFWGKVSISWASLDSKANLWDKLDPNTLKHVMSDVHKVHWAEVKRFHDRSYVMA